MNRGPRGPVVKQEVTRLDVTRTLVIARWCRCGGCGSSVRRADRYCRACGCEFTDVEDRVL
jgi:predicted amidophosphoribosyltransferase